MMRNIAFAATDVASKVLNFSKRKLLEMLSISSSNYVITNLNSDVLVGLYG